MAISKEDRDDIIHNSLLSIKNRPISDYENKLVSKYVDKIFFELRERGAKLSKISIGETVCDNLSYVWREGVNLERKMNDSINYLISDLPLQYHPSSLNSSRATENLYNLSSGEIEMLARFMAFFETQIIGKFIDDSATIAIDEDFRNKMTLELKSAILSVFVLSRNFEAKIRI